MYRDTSRERGSRIRRTDNKPIDFMAKGQKFKLVNAVDKEVRLKAKKVYGIEEDIWVQGKTKAYRDTLKMVLNNLPSDTPLPKIVIVSDKKLKGLAAYNHAQDTLYVSNVLNSNKNIKLLLKDDYFASKNMKDILTHELAHKQHWDSAKKLYNDNKKVYNNLEEAKNKLDYKLMKYVKQQRSNDFRYVYNLSKNADSAFNVGNINEVVAEVTVLGTKTPDKILFNKVKEVLEYGNNSKTK